MSRIDRQIAVVSFVAGAAGAVACGGQKSDIALEQSAAAVELDVGVTLASEADIEKRRQELIQFVWGRSTLPDTLPANVRPIVPSPVGPLTNLDRIEELTFKMEAGEHSMAHHFIAKTSNNRLVIMHQGHGCTLSGDEQGAGPDYWGIGHAIDELLAHGYSVLGMYMPYYEPDPNSPSRPSIQYCPKKPIQDTLWAHDWMFAGGVKPQAGNPVKFFLEPVAVSLKYLRSNFPNYISYDMVGLSGGGWATVFYSAIDPTVDRSIDVSGSIPFHMRKCESGRLPTCRDYPGGNGYGGYEGDAEQALPAIYQASGGYLDLYAMGAQGSNRRHIQLINRVDEIPAGPGSFTRDQFERNVRDYEKLVQAAVARTKAGGSYQAIFDTVAPHHMISKWAVANVILPTLVRSASPVDAATVNDGSSEKPAASIDADSQGADVSEASRPEESRSGGSCAVGGSSSRDGLAAILGAVVWGSLIVRRRLGTARCCPRRSWHFEEPKPRRNADGPASENSRISS